MSHTPLYPLRFEPIYQYRLWGGRRLSGLLSSPLPSKGPIGEAWVLSDREDHSSQVANGGLKGQTIGTVMQRFQNQLMGKLANHFLRFPLRLKFLTRVRCSPSRCILDIRRLNVCQRQRLQRPKPGLCCRRRKKAASMRVSSQGPPRKFSGNRSRTRRWQITFHRSPQSPAMASSSRLGRFTPWAGTSGFEVQRTATQRFACMTGATSTRRQAGRGTPGRSGACLHRLHGWCSRTGNACGGDKDAGAAREVLRLRRVPALALERRTTLHHCHSRSAARAGVHRGPWADRAGGDTYTVSRGEVWLLQPVIESCLFRPANAVSLLEIEARHRSSQATAKWFAELETLAETASIQGWIVNEEADRF